MGEDDWLEAAYEERYDTFGNADWSEYMDDDDDDDDDLLTEVTLADTGMYPCGICHRVTGHKLDCPGDSAR